MCVLFLLVAYEGTCCLQLRVAVRRCSLDNSFKYRFNLNSVYLSIIVFGVSVLLALHAAVVALRAAEIPANVSFIFFLYISLFVFVSMIHFLENNDNSSKTTALADLRLARWQSCC